MVELRKINFNRLAEGGDSVRQAMTKTELNWGDIYDLILATQGATILSGTGPPASTVGDENYYYIDVNTHDMYGPKVGGLWGTPVSLIGPKGDTGLQGLQGIAGPEGPQGPQGIAGPEGPIGVSGRTWISGSGIPASTQGVDGDFYMDITNHQYYGPKTAGAWGSGTSIIGPEGPAGGQYVHQQSVAASTWTINHTLNGFPSVTIVDSTGDQIFSDVNYVSSTQVVVNFGSPFSGTAYLYN